MASLGLTTVYVGYNTKEGKDGKVRIVTSFYPMYIATLNIVEGIPDVELHNLSEPQTGCLHDFQLTPGDMQLLSTADVFVVNGGGIEGFLSDVAKAYPNLVIVDASEGLDMLEEDEEHAHGEAHEDEENEGDSHEHGDDVNAHAWMSVELYRKQVVNIAKGLSQADASHEAAYASGARFYDGKLEELAKEQEDLESLLEGRKVVLFHEAYEYVASEYGMDVVCVLDLDEERQVSAGEVASVITAVEQDGAQVILAEELYGKAMADTIQRECQVEILFLDALNRGEYNADSYMLGMRRNMELLRKLCE